MKLRTWLSLSLVLGGFFLSAPTISAEATKYAEVQRFLRAVADQSHGNAELFTLGVSDSGETIEGLKIGNGPVNNLVVATHHGNEYGATEVAKGFAADLAQNPIAGQTVWVIPVLNISGYNAGQRQEKMRDPNRDYPGPCGTEGPHRLKSTRALAEFIEQKGIVTSATLHTYYPAVVYPWGISTHDLKTPHEAQFMQLVAASVIESGYQTGNSTEVIYPADGAYEDYAYWKHGIWSLLFELGSSHYPDKQEVQQMIAVNVPGIRRFLTIAPTTRAANHAFTGRCSRTRLKPDRHDE